MKKKKGDFEKNKGKYYKLNNPGKKKLSKKLYKKCKRGCNKRQGGS